MPAIGCLLSTSLPEEPTCDSTTAASAMLSLAASSPVATSPVSRKLSLRPPIKNIVKTATITTLATRGPIACRSEIPPDESDRRGNDVGSLNRRTSFSFLLFAAKCYWRRLSMMVIPAIWRPTESPLHERCCYLRRLRHHSNQVNKVDRDQPHFLNLRKSNQQTRFNQVTVNVSLDTKNTHPSLGDTSKAGRKSSPITVSAKTGIAKSTRKKVRRNRVLGDKRCWRQATFPLMSIKSCRLFSIVSYPTIQASTALALGRQSVTNFH